jgi:hypothetical protein
MLGRAWVSVVLVVGLTGCAPHPRSSHFRPVVNIPLECAKEIHLLDCDLTFNPPHCRTVTVTYRHGCEQLVVAK